MNAFTTKKRGFVMLKKIGAAVFLVTGLSALIFSNMGGI